MILNKKFFTVGAWLQCSNSNSAEIISRNNFDWICLDFEHGAYDFSNIQDVIRSIQLSKKKCFVRSMSHNPSEISKLMDMGIDGIFVPKVETVNHVRLLYNSIYFHPKGERGVAYSRANNYGDKFKVYMKNSKKNLFIGMIESKKGVQNIENILKENLLNGIFIGPYDLSSSLGNPGNFNNKEFKDSINHILKITKKYNIPCGIHILDNKLKNLSVQKKKGFSFIAYMTDTIMLLNYKPI